MFRTRFAVDPGAQRLEAYEPVSEVQRPRCRREDTEMVVGSQQLEDS